MKKRVLQFMMCMVFITPVFSQEFQDVVHAETEEELDEICRSAYLGFMSTQKEIEETVDQILATVGINSIEGANFKLKACDKINNAVAKNLTIKGKEVRYVLYDPSMLQNIVNKTHNNWSAKFVLAHEIGHHINGHSMNNGTSNHDYELQADYFAGRALALMGATEEETLAATTILSERATATHPARAQRAERASEGWNSVERTRVVKVRDGDIDEIAKTMVANVETNLKENYSILTIEQFNKLYQILDLARTKYYKGYTEDIRYFEALCLTGMGEQTKAENAYINYLSIEDLDSQARIKQIVSLYLNTNSNKSSFFQNPIVLYEMGVECYNRGLYDKAISYGNQFLQFSDPKTDGNKISEINKLIGNSEFEKIMKGESEAGTLERGYKAFENQEWSKAFELLTKGGEAKDAKTQCYVGYMYSSGQGVSFDAEKGKALLLSSSGKGFGQAQYLVGYYYYHGAAGFPKDLNQAKYWLQKTLESGVANNYKVQATELLSKIEYENTISPPNTTKIENNNLSGREKLAVYIANGNSYFNDGMYSDAYTNFIKAAEMGDAYSQEKVAWMLYKGKGIDKDKDKAIEWWRSAAKQGNIEAINTLTRLGEW